MTTNLYGSISPAEQALRKLLTPDMPSPHLSIDDSGEFHLLWILRKGTELQASINNVRVTWEASIAGETYHGTYGSTDPISSEFVEVLETFTKVVMNAVQNKVRQVQEFPTQGQQRSRSRSTDREREFESSGSRSNQ